LMTIGDNGNVGIGLMEPTARLQVAGGAIMPAAGNSEQAGIMFPKDPGSGAGDAAWIRYYARSGEQTTLEIGTSNDPQDHIALMPTGNVGIGTTDPKAKLDVAGTIKGGGVLAGIWAAQPTSNATISVLNSWQAVADTFVEFTLDRPAIVFCTYSITVQPLNAPGTGFLGTILAVDGARRDSSGAHWQPFTSGDPNSVLSGNLVLELNDNRHTIALQWLTAGTTGALEWQSLPQWRADGSSIGGRSLVIMAFYK
jgi:hypothetical protein